MKRRGLLVLALCGLLMGCGIPRAALRQAQLEAAVVMPASASDAEVRAALRRQASAWRHFAQSLRQREFGGIGRGDPGFADLAERTAAIAARQVELLDQGRDEPALNRAILLELQRQWVRAGRNLER